MTTAAKPARVRGRRLAGAFTTAAKSWAEAKAPGTPPAAMEEPIRELTKLAAKQEDNDSRRLVLVLMDFTERCARATYSLLDHLEDSPDVEGVDHADLKGHTWTAEELAAIKRVEAEWAEGSVELHWLRVDTPWVADCIRAWCEVEPVSWDGRRREAARAFLAADNLADRVTEADTLAVELRRFRLEDFEAVAADRLALRLATFAERGGGPEVQHALHLDVAVEVFGADRRKLELDTLRAVAADPATPADRVERAGRMIAALVAEGEAERAAA